LYSRFNYFTRPQSLYTVVICGLISGCAVPNKEDLQPFGNAVRSIVSVYAGAPVMNEQQQQEFNQRWQEDHEAQIRNMLTGAQILEQTRSLTQVQKADYERQRKGREIRVEGYLVDVLGSNPSLLPTGKKYSSGNALVVVGFDGFGQAIVNINKSNLHQYQHRSKGERSFVHTRRPVFIASIATPETNWTLNLNRIF
jgi:FlaA1/EpsC-like NDP-sugar epimerase